MPDSVMQLLNGLTIYRRILKDEVISAFIEGDFNQYNALIIEKAYKLGLNSDPTEYPTAKNTLAQYIYKLFLHDENVYTLACENGQDTSALYPHALKDMEVLLHLGHDGDLAALTKHYKTNGAGDMARFSMFSLTANGRLKGVAHPDTVTFEDIIGIDLQKAALRQNTEAFLSNKPANNMLLVGSRGSGKSSCIKALVNQYNNQYNTNNSLRLIEVTKDQIELLPELVETLSNRGKYFIIFMDDLSFEQSETQYKYLKSLLEGGAGLRPGNVLFYATSNRRHIIRESHKDRNTADDELHISDTINEIMSLSDRFGLTLYFPHIGKEEYLEIVTGLANRLYPTLDINLNELHAKAMQWSVENKRMSGRTAVQFLNHFLGHAENMEAKK